MFLPWSTVSNRSELPYLYKSYDLLVTQIAVLSAMILSAETVGSRGSGYVKDGPQLSMSPANQAIVMQGSVSRFEPVRPIPESGGWFEKVWREFTMNRG